MSSRVKCRPYRLAHGAEAVGAAGELRVHGEQVAAPGLGLPLFGEHPREVADAVDAQALGFFLGHGQGVGVVEAGRLQPDQALGFVERLDATVGSRGVELLVDVVVDDQRRAGVLPDDIQLAAFLGGARQGAAQAGGDAHVVAALLQELRGDGGEDALFGEGLAADAQGFRLRQAGGEEPGASQAEGSEQSVHQASLAARPRSRNVRLNSTTRASSSRARSAVQAAPSSSCWWLFR